MDRNHSRTIRIVERHFHRNKKETWFPLKLVTKPLSFHTFLPLKVSLKSSINSGKRNFSPHFTSVERTNIYKLGRRILFNFYDWIFPFIEWKINCSVLILVNNCKHKKRLRLTRVSLILILLLWIRTVEVIDNWPWLATINFFWRALIDTISSSLSCFLPSKVI